MIMMRVFSRTRRGKQERQIEASHAPSMACLVDGAALGRRGAATADRREERHKHNTNASYVQGGWRVVVVVVVEQ